MDGFPRIVRSLSNRTKFLLGLSQFLNHPITGEYARQTIARRLEQREENFIRFMDRCIFSHAASPYLPLLRQAGCSFSDVISEVKKQGVEGLLKALKDSGVWISADEYKGLKPVRRGNFEQLFRADAFDNPNKAGSWGTHSGGSSGRPIQSHLYLDTLAERACYDHLMFTTLDLHDTPLAVWYPTLPGTVGISNVLRYCKIGRPPQRWFRLLTDEVAPIGFDSRLANRAILLSSRFSKVKIPNPEPLDLDQADVVVDWILDMLDKHGKAAMQTYVSQAVRVCVAASGRGLDLEGTVFIVGSEALTKAKFQQIRSVNGRVFPRYMASELGSIGMGCGEAADADDYHLLSDMIAMIQDGGGRPEDEPRPLYFTTFVGSVPKVLLNAEIGDTGLVTRKACGCTFGEIGLDTHVSRIRNYAQTSAEGMSMGIAVLRRIVEEVLPARHGGSPLDYQWVESEDDSAFTKLTLRVHPRIGPLDHAKMTEDVLAEMGRHDQFSRRYAETWRQAGSMHIERVPPELTQGGKLVPFLRAS
ncbi:MAG: hypothetical protein P8182_02160 [Deltaproteobacteria bacterium]